MAMKEMKTISFNGTQYEVVDEKARTDLEAAKKTLANKADKKVPAAAGNVATLDTSGNLADGGKKYAPDARSVNMNSPVGVDANGKLWSDSTACRLYTVKWDKTSNTMTRMNAAEGITTTTTNFRHAGSVNASYSNPFDNIYPWSGIKLCNIDITKYMALQSGDRVTDCVVAWEGDPDFSYTHENGVWRYSPEFWGRTWDDGTYRYFEVTDQALGGYIHYPECIKGRWHGVKVSRTIGESAKDILLPLADMPAAVYAISNMHTQAKNYGATLDSIYTIDADALLFIVEYANMNAQAAIGQGVSSMYHAGNVNPVAVEGNVVTVKASDAGAVEVGSIIGFQNASGDSCNLGRYEVTKIDTVDTNKNLTLKGTLNTSITTASFWGLFGKVSTQDAQIGSKSGYIGADSKSIAYYRGAELYANMFFYVLGAYREQNTNHVWIAKSIEEADNYDALDTKVHIDTGLKLATGADGAAANGYIKELGIAKGLAAAPICTSTTGGDSTRPVGDYLWMPAQTASNTILILGGRADNGLRCGPFSAYWNPAASDSWWASCARPVLKNP